MKFSDLAYDLWSLFYPRICPACDNPLVRNEEFLCTTCLMDLPRTHFHKDPENEVAQMFWGRIKVENASAYLYFQKKSKVQHLLHKLKYKGDKEIGRFLGRMAGNELKETPFGQIDMIISLPLHPKKQKIRGYNQSEMIALGLGEAMGKKIETNVLIRKFANTTQTRKHRYERWLNVEEVFEVVNYDKIANKHVLLVDDVVTTGATLEASAGELLKAGNTKVSIVTLAKA
ncbi:MAG TPA: ComF family protein [Bacteroidales bacterium]|nr:ComF family protein [Bacteroidales bacterium]